MPPIDFLAPLGKLLVNVEPFARFLLLGELEPHDQLVFLRLAVQGKAGRIRPAVFQGLEHGRHFLSDRARFTTMNESGNSAHTRFLLKFVMRVAKSELQFFNCSSAYLNVSITFATRDYGR